MANEDVAVILEKAWPGWKVVRLIGEGAYGKVYEIQKTDFGEAFSAALKVIQIPNDSVGLGSLQASMTDVDITQYYESVTETLMKEYHIMSKLRGNSNIVSYEDHVRVPREDGIGWSILIRMELLTPLSGYVYNNGITRQGVIRLGIDICRALELCRKYKVIHRDIKPENIFISEFGDYKLGDFGVARMLEETHGMLSKQGTSLYMAPEVYANKGYDAGVDIYSLGLVLYQYLNKGKLPFSGEKVTYQTQVEALNRRMNGEALPAPSGESGALGEIVRKACSYEPGDRYQTPTEMREALEGLVDLTDQKVCLYSHNTPPSPTIQVRFFGDDKKLISTKAYFENEPAEVPAGPEKADAGGWRYIFTGWKPEVKTPVTRDADYTAVYRRERIVTPEELAQKAEKTKKTFAVKPPKRIVWIAAAAAAVAVVVLIAALAGGRKGSSGTDGAASAARTAGLAEQGETQEGDWSEWMEKLPDSVTADNSVVETKYQYRMAPIAVSDSRESPGTNFVLCYARYGAYGSWSDWQDDPPEEDDTRQVETAARYRYQKLYGRQTGNAYHSATKTSYYWSDWQYSDTPVSASSTCRVEEVTQYRFRERTAVYCFCDNALWTEFDDKVLSPSDDFAVDTRQLWRYAPRSASAVPAASMDHFPASYDSYAGRFADVDDSAWYGSDKSTCLATAAQLGAIVPNEYMCFRPEDALTLAEAVRAAVTVRRIYNGEQGILPETGVWYQVYVDYAVANGMIGADDFPDYTAPATREAAAYIMQSALPAAELTGVNIVSSVTDMDLSSKYYKSVYQLAQAGIISWPTPDYAFGPENPITRAEAAAFVDRIVRPENRLVNG